MTEPTRSARPRRRGRRPGWLLLTVLLVLAIGASSALVFTDRVELLKLAVILALWAAVVAAFVSVIYRRQSDMDQAKVRDLKLVYDLQLDREISARREYELSVETQLRRELVSELRAQAADEVAGLRAELAALRANLEILFDADLSHRPALETDRTGARAYSDWARDPRDRRPGHRQPNRHGKTRPTTRTSAPTKARSSTCRTNPIRRSPNGCRRLRLRGVRTAGRQRRSRRVGDTRPMRPRHTHGRRHRSRDPSPRPSPSRPPSARAGRARARACRLAGTAVDGLAAGSGRRTMDSGGSARQQLGVTHRRKRLLRRVRRHGGGPPSRRCKLRPPTLAAAATPHRRMRPIRVDHRRRRHWPPNLAARHRTPNRLRNRNPRHGIAAPTRRRPPGGSRLPSCWRRLQATPAGGGGRRRREE